MHAIMHNDDIVLKEFIRLLVLETEKSRLPRLQLRAFLERDNTLKASRNKRADLTQQWSREWAC